MEDIDLEPDEKKKIRDCLSSVVTLRTSLGYKIGIKKNTEPDKLAQFLTGVSEAGERLFKIIIDWIYTAEHDEAILDHLRQKRNAKDVVKLPLIADAIKEIAEQLEQHKEAAQDLKMRRRSLMMTKQMVLLPIPLRPVAIRLPKRRLCHQNLLEMRMANS